MGAGRPRRAVAGGRRSRAVAPRQGRAAAHGRLLGAATVAVRPKAGAGDARVAARYRPAGRRPVGIHAGRRQGKTRRRCSAVDRGAGRAPAGPGIANGHGAGGGQRGNCAVRAGRPGAGGYPAVPVRGDDRDHRRPVARRAAGRTRRRAAEPAADRQGRGDRPPPAGDRGTGLWHRRQVRLPARCDRRSGNHRADRSRDADRPPRRPAVPCRERARRHRTAHRSADHPRRPHGDRNGRQPAGRRGVATEQPSGGRDQWRARQVARAADIGRAAPGGAHLAPPAEGRSVGRPGAFHHFAPAGKGRPHAAERARADRLPGASRTAGCCRCRTSRTSPTGCGRAAPCS